MSFAAAEQWFEAWQLRLLVLASLFFQYFLFAAAVVRKLRVPPWFRALIWLAYQAGDVVAIYALATLFNEHKERVAAHHLDTLWAPVLLLHLGGQDGITAYSIEDNENWRRYLLLAVCQITVAVYVFRKSWWSGDLLLLRAAILLFVPGFLKCLEKPWALKNATATSIINSSDSRMKATLDLDNELQKEIFSQEEYVMAAAECVAEFQPKQLELFVDEVADQPHHLFVDLGHPYSIRLCNLRLVAPKAARADVHSLLRSSLSKAFDRLYTKHKASFGGLLRAAVVLLTFVDIGLFQKSHRRGLYERADVVVTYVLLCCTAALEFVSACVVLSSGLPWPDDRLAQYNLVGYLARGEKQPWFWALMRRLGARLQLDRLWCTAPPEPSLGITRLVYDYLADGWKGIRNSLYEWDDATRGWKLKPTALADGVRAYRQFNDSRGQRTLEREKCVRVEPEKCVDWSRSAIEESLRMPFDESVLLWHLATEFCYFDHVDTGNDATRHSRMVSNYMAYLLFVEPEMLIPGARNRLFRATYLDLRKMLRPPPEEDDEAIEVEPTEKKAPPPRAKNEMVRKVIQKVKSSTIVNLASEDLVHKAWAVAHELMEFAELKKQEFIVELKERGDKRKNVMNVLRCAKMKADEFIDIKKREEVLNKLIHDMCSSQKEADEFVKVKSNKAEEAMQRKKNFMKVMKEAKEKAELFIKEEKNKKQTEEAGLTKLLQCVKYKAEEIIKNEEEKKELEGCCTPTDTEQEKEKKVKEFSENAGEIIKVATLLVEEEKKKLVKGMGEAKDKAVEFINEAAKFISEEKTKNQTKEEEKIRDLLESAGKKAEEFVAVAQASWKEEEKEVLEFSKHAGFVIQQEAEENQRRKELKEWHLIVDEDELCMIRSREHADDKMWAVIQGVWVEMLCFSAGRCRGYLHAKSLGNGGEYLSYVWLLLYYMGMETMPERVQRPELPTLGDTGATPADEDMDDDDDDEPAQVRTATGLRRRRRAIHDAPIATPLPQVCATPVAQTAPQQAQQQQRVVAVVDPCATPPPQAGATSDGQAVPQQAQPQQLRLVATPVPAISATAVVPVVGDDIV